MAVTDCSCLAAAKEVSIVTTQPTPFVICGNERRSGRREVCRRLLVFDAGSGNASHFCVSFESRFEGGNLSKVFSTTDYEDEYDLELRPDDEPASSPKRHVGWFFFAMSSQQHRRIRLNIVGLNNKHGDLIRLGTQPVVLSSLRCDSEGWVRAGSELAFFSDDGGTSFVFSFLLEINASETLWIAQSFPYTVSNLRRDLSRLFGVAPQGCISRHTLAISACLALPCDVLTITSPTLSMTEDALPLAERSGVLITARVHPGETSASWVMRGFLEFLCSRNIDAVFLRNHCVIKVIPMLNIDGVARGCTRNAPSSGIDLNRVWESPDFSTCPTVSAAKSLAEKFASERRMILFVDLHGHSKKVNAFTYGCGGTGATSLLPRLLSLYCTQFFALGDCTQSVASNKQGTARVALWRELGISGSYTLETSMGGTSSSGQFTQQQYMEIGKALCIATKDMWNGSSMSTSILSVIVDTSQERNNPEMLPPQPQQTLSRPDTRAKPRNAVPTPPRIIRPSLLALQTPEEPWRGYQMPQIMPTTLRLQSRCSSHQRPPQLSATEVRTIRPLTVYGFGITSPLFEDRPTSYPPIPQQKRPSTTAITIHQQHRRQPSAAQTPPPHGKQQQQQHHHW